MADDCSTATVILGFYVRSGYGGKFFMLQWSFGQRQVMLLLLGTASWLIAATLTAAILSMPGGPVGQWFWPVILLSLLNITAYLYNGWHLYNHCVREPARWRTNNRDWRSWLAVSVCHLSALGLIHVLPVREAELALLAPFGVIVAPFLNRFTPPVALITIGANTLGLAICARGGMSPGEVVLLLIVQLALWLLGLGGVVEQREKHKLQVTLAQLRATQELLSAAVADTERQRIARDLHDRMGHHLVGLKMQLQLAELGATPAGQPKPMTLARELVGELFTDVRETVQQLHDKQPFNFGVALRAMLGRISSLQFEISGDVPEQIDDYLTADCLLRCIQEAITNTLKHSNASQMSLFFQRRGPELCLTLRDNGQQKKPDGPSSGHGLTGMQQRLAALDGSVVWQRQQGFEVRICLPLNPPEAGDRLTTLA